MSQNEMVAKIEELNELEILMDGLKAQADAIRDDIKSEMAAQGTEELNLGKYIVRWTSVLSTRFDTKRFKEAFGEELYKAYTKEVSSRRFSIAYAAFPLNLFYTRCKSGKVPLLLVSMQHRVRSV